MDIPQIHSNPFRKSGRTFLRLLTTCVLLLSCLGFPVIAQNQKAYVVVLNEKTYPWEGKSTESVAKDEDGSDFIAEHDNILASIVTRSSEESPTKLYSYFSAINGFSALLSKSQVEQLKGNSKIAHIFSDGMLKKDTTQSSSFLGLNQTSGGAWSRTNGTNVVIGVIDDGIWPESQSFAPGKLGPVPTKFKGVCQTGQKFTKKHCNRKIVGARYFARGFLASGFAVPRKSFPADYPDFVSPRSPYGHGVHVSGIAGGNLVSDARVGGFSFGVAKGVAFSSRIAAYKVCWGDFDTGECTTSDVVAGIDQAVRDGVDVISMSLGYKAKKFSDDHIAQAMLGAALAGVPCIVSGGNGGPSNGKVNNVYPWALTAAASSLDRVFQNSILLGNGKTYPAIGITSGMHKEYPLLFGLDKSYWDSEFCGSLNPRTVKNKIVYCRASYWLSVASQSRVVYEAGGVGMIVSRPRYSDGKDGPAETDFFRVPTAQISSLDAERVEGYLTNSKSPTARISAFKTLVGPKNVEAPFMASFSSPGPNLIYDQILKPDITAPGIDILSAWPEDSRSPVLPFGKTAKFNLLSGTSMSCPHVSGAIALLKAFYPKWPVSWLYSAVMTTAYTKTNRNRPIMIDGVVASPLNYGAGHLNVNQALYPGLVYSWAAQDLTLFKCLTSNNTRSQTCRRAIQPYELNLPSLSLPSLCKTKTVIRRLTNAEMSPSDYRVTVSSPKGAVVTVTPNTLRFNKFGQVLSYKITVKPVTPYDDLNLDYAASGFTYGSVTWVGNNRRRVKLTLAVSVPGYC